MYFEFEWGSIFMLKKSINRLLFSIIIFLCFISHLLQFWTYKQLLYTKLEEMLYGFCRTWPFLAICYRAWAIGSEASPLFYCPLLIHVVNFPQTLTFWGLESIHDIYNVPSEPEQKKVLGTGRDGQFAQINFKFWKNWPTLLGPRRFSRDFITHL